MKENFKTGILFIGIFYMLVISFLMISAVDNGIATIEYDDISVYTEKLENMKKGVEELEDNDCTSDIKSLIEFSEKTNFVNETKIKDIYSTVTGKDGWLVKYGRAIESCELTEEQKDDISPFALASGIQFDELFHKHAYDYELRLPDSVRTLLEPSMENIENVIRKNLEMEVVEKLIEVQNEK